MPKKLTREQFIKKAEDLYGNKYDYSNVVYVNNRTPVEIICQTHGAFKQTPAHFLSGHACQECGKVESAEKRKHSTAKFIEDARRVHGDRYDYSLAEYRGCYENVTIVCRKHGPFMQQAYVHTSGHGCPHCGLKSRVDMSRMTTEMFIRLGKQKYGGRFSYEKTNYIDTYTPVTVTCKKHGDYEIRPSYFLHRGPGCKACALEKRKKLRFGVWLNDINLPIRHECTSIWLGMLRRCYDEKTLKRYPSYKGCKVCGDWHLLSNFKAWWDANRIPGYDMDKDLLSNGNGKVYSPETVVFVPRGINTLLTERKAPDGSHCGAWYDKRRGKYLAYISRYGRPKCMGAFLTKVEAYSAYKAARESYIKEVAEKFFSDGKITRQVYDALMRYEVEITD